MYYASAFVLTFELFKVVNEGKGHCAAGLMVAARRPSQVWIETAQMTSS